MLLPFGFLNQEFRRERNKKVAFKWNKQIKEEFLR